MELTLSGLVISWVHAGLKRRHHYYVWFPVLYFSTLNLLLLTLAEGKLPPTPDDPLYTDHSIWEKGTHEVTEAERVRIAEKNRVAELEAKELQEKARLEQE